VTGRTEALAYRTIYGGHRCDSERAAFRNDMYHVTSGILSARGTLKPSGLLSEL